MMHMIQTAIFLATKLLFLMEQKNKDAILNIIKQKHIAETREYIPITAKKNDLLMWNVIFVREIIKQDNRSNLFILYIINIIEPFKH